MIQSRTSRKNVARQEREQQKLDAGIVATHFPQVAGIMVQMKYNQKGIAQSLPRTVNFFPSSCALFKIDCLNKDCIDGGFDLTPVIKTMIRKRHEKNRGELSCEGDGPPAEHSTIVYEIVIQYL